MGNDLRRYARQTNIRLVFGFILIVFIIGDGLIYIFLGREASIMGFICLVAGMSPFILTLAALWLIDWIARQGNKD